MNCRDMEKLIALNAGGDLPAPDADRVREHLDGCAACRAATAELAESQAMLAALRSESLDERTLANWRRSLMDRIEAGGRQRRFPWPWAWAAVAAGVLLVLTISHVAMRRTQPAPAPIVAHVAPPPPPPAEVQPRRVAHIHRRRPRLNRCL